MPFGWFEPRDEDRVPDEARFVILIGNAGPQMFRRFVGECNPASPSMDDWTRVVVDRMAETLGAKAAYPFAADPPLPFLSWARRARAGHVSPLGLNIHPTYGLWHAYRAALLFPFVFDLPQSVSGSSPCESCAAKPCLSACPVSAFDGTRYDVVACGQHLNTPQGEDCLTGGCKARLACPVGREFTYHPRQIDFHMQAFLKARQADVRQN